MAETISIGEVKKLVNHTIDNNRRLEEEGEYPIALGIEAAAGVGKTSILEQIAKERGMGYTKISLHELDEPGDILGYPQTEYECQMAKVIAKPDGTKAKKIMPGTVWLNAKQIDNKEPGILYRQTGRTRMGYAKPAWVPEYNENGNMVVWDDFVRANPALLQATMELILTQKGMGWSFPKGTSSFLTNNPDDGTYAVQTLDPAQRGRFVSYNVEWDCEAWAQWAEKKGIDGRCINFALSYANELFRPDEEGNRICSPRTYVMFSNMIAGIKDWDSRENLEFISLIAKGCFEDGKGKFSAMFTSFIKNKMHLLIQPKEVLMDKWEDVKKKLTELLYDKSTGQYRPDIASLLERRFSNYVCTWLASDQKTPISTVVNRIVNFIDSDIMFFNKDLLFHMVKTITGQNKGQTNKLLFEPKIAQMIS